MLKNRNLPELALGTGNISGALVDSKFAMNIEEQAILIAASIELFRKNNLKPWIDTAPYYGKGNALIAIGLALGENPPKDITFSTKIGRILVAPTKEKPYEGELFYKEGTYNIKFDYSAEGVAESYMQNLEFLNKGRKEKGWKELEAKDFENFIVFIHDPEEACHGSNTANILLQVKNETLPALNGLKLDEKLTHIGVGTNEVKSALFLADHRYLDIVMVAGRFTLLANNAPNATEEIKKDTNEIIKLYNLAKANNKIFVSAAAGNAGAMFPEGLWYNYKAISEDNKKYRDEIIAICNQKKVPIGNAVLRFPLDAGANSVVMGGFTLDHINKNLKDFSEEVPNELWQELRERGFINHELDIGRNKKVQDTLVNENQKERAL